MKHKAKYIAVLTITVFLSAKAWCQYDFDRFFFRGIQALSEGKYAKSIENFNVVARLDTSDYWNFFYRGIAKYNLGDFRGAQNDFDRSIRINPVFTSGYHYRAITENRFGNYDQALEDLQRAMELRPGMEGLYFSRGVTYFLAQDFDKAIEDFNRYIRKQPTDPSAFLNRGASNLFLGDTTSAMCDYNRAIQLDGFEPEGYIRRGRLYASLGEYDKAIEDLDKAISLDSTSTFAYFNRALMYYETKDYNAAMADLNRVLRDEPGNALTLYNRSLISAQVGNYEDALADMDRVININPKNVLAYYNRAAFFAQMERWEDALDDYTKAIELYPDFARAYMNRSYVENLLGLNKESKKDYNIAQKKIQEYKAANDISEGSFADTTRKYSSLLALDAEFAKKDFDDELLQHRDIDIRLRPFYKFVITEEDENVNYALRNRYENVLLDKFMAESPVPITITCQDSLEAGRSEAVEKILYSSGMGRLSAARRDFTIGMYESSKKQYNSSLLYYGKALDEAGPDKYETFHKAYYLLNRGVLRAEMIDFINSIESNVQTLTMDDKGTIRARVQDMASRTYDYSEALEDLEKARDILGDNPYIHYNLGNIYCLSSHMVEAIDSYTKAISLYRYMGDAYFNRGLVQVYLKDREKGCMDLSIAGEMGIADAYSVISKYCEEEE